MTMQWIFQACALMGAALLVGMMIRQRASAALRHAIYLAAVLAVLLLPALSRISATVPLQVSAIEVPALTVQASGSAPLDWNWVIRQVWLAGVVLVALRYVAGAGRAMWLTRTSTPFRDDARLHAGVRVPMVIGWIRPQIILPASARQWPEERIRTAMAHERAHIRRFDCVWTLVAGAATALYWFLPPVWILVDRLRQEAERACDDSVLRSGVDAEDYATHLIEAAREAGQHWEPAAGIAMADAPKLESRVVAVLDGTTRRSSLGKGAAAATAAAAALLVLLVSGTITSRAQDVAGGRVEITVVDASGGRVPQAKVTVEDSSARIQVARTTLDDGSVRVDSLPPGDYLIEVQAAGFKPANKAIRLDSQSGARVAFALDVGQIFESVKVTGGQAPAQTPAPTRIRVGGNVQAGKLISQVQVPYPQAAKDQRIEGTVFLQAVILKDGTIGSLEVLGSPSPILSNAATDGVRQWTYQPTLLNGEPIEVVTKISANFTLSE